MNCSSVQSPSPVAGSGVRFDAWIVPNGVAMPRPPANGAPPRVVWHATQSPSRARYAPRAASLTIAFQADAGGNALRERHGIAVEALTAAGIREMEPGLAPIYAMGRYIREAGHTTNPHRLVQKLCEMIVRKGGRILREAGVRRVLLVTHALHMRRARAAFERTGLEESAADTFAELTLAVQDLNFLLSRSFLPDSQGNH
mgnify:CR=1 FL=1